MLDFEQAIATFLGARQIPFEFKTGSHLLITENLRIRFIPACSLAVEEWRPLTQMKDETFTIRLWEDVFNNRQAVVLARLATLLGLNERIHARSTQVVRPARGEFDAFVAGHHLLMPTKTKYRYGLAYRNKLVAVAGFGRSCPMQYNGRTYLSHELIRYAGASGYTVVGGLSKLLGAFVKERQPEHIMTYVDKEWSDGRGFLQIGFEIAAETPPQEFWLDPAHCQRHSPARDAKLPAGWQRISNRGNIKLIKIY